MHGIISLNAFFLVKNLAPKFPRLLYFPEIPTLMLLEMPRSTVLMQLLTRINENYTGPTMKDTYTKEKSI